MFKKPYDKITEQTNNNIVGKLLTRSSFFITCFPKGHRELFLAHLMDHLDFNSETQQVIIFSL